MNVIIAVVWLRTNLYTIRYKETIIAFPINTEKLDLDHSATKCNNFDGHNID